MQLQRPLRVITPTVDGDVLTALARADTAFTGRGLHRVIGRYSVDGVRKALDRLEQQGIVDVEDVGAAKAYSLNRDHLAASHVIDLARLSDAFVDQLRDRLNAWRPPPVYAALFGSAARSDMRPDSDIDLFVVRPDSVDDEDARWTARVRDLSTDAARWTGNDLRVLEVSDSEVRRGVRARRQVFRDIRNDGIRLIGPASYLKVARQDRGG
jgi:predicted nucleotidyltransferase